MEMYPYLNKKEHEEFIKYTKKISEHPISKTPITDYNDAIHKLTKIVMKLKPLPSSNNPVNPISKMQAENLEHLENTLLKYINEYPHYKDSSIIDSYIDDLRIVILSSDMYGPIYNQLLNYLHQYEAFIEYYATERNKLVLHIQSLMYLFNI